MLIDSISNDIESKSKLDELSAELTCKPTSSLATTSNGTLIDLDAISVAVKVLGMETVVATSDAL